MAPCDLIIHIDKEDIVDTGVFEVMKSCRDQATHLLKIVQLKLVFHTATDCKVVESLAHISSMSLVMIHDLLVPLSKCPHKLHQRTKV